MHNDRAEQTAGGGTKSAVGTQRTPRSVPRYRFVATAVVAGVSSGTRLPARTSQVSHNGWFIRTLKPVRRYGGGDGVKLGNSPPGENLRVEHQRLLHRHVKPVP